MYLNLTDEQSFLLEAATGTLARHDTTEAARAALDGVPAPDLWPVAVEAGWPGLLIAEDADGAELGAYEALLVLEACGRRLADARLLGHLPATALLQAAGAPVGLRAAVASGERRAALVDAALGDRSRPLEARREDGAVRVTGTVSGVLDAPGASLLVVVAQDEDGTPVAGTVDAGAAGVSVAEPAGAPYDATRALADVRLDGAVLEPLALDGAQISGGRDLQRALLAAESVGAADACLGMARDYAVDRHAFGRAIGSYQAIKHKLVEMLRRVEGARSLLVAAGRDWGRPAFAVSANAARVVAADALDYSAPENIFIHGGVGATWEHDASLYYRRAELARRLAGGADAAALAVADGLLDAAAVPACAPVPVTA